MYEIREKGNPLALHATGFHSRERAQAWIDHVRDDMANGRHIFTDKSLTADSFEVVEK